MAGFEARINTKGAYRQPCVGFFMRDAQLHQFYGGLGEATSVGRS